MVQFARLEQRPRRRCFKKPKTKNPQTIKFGKQTTDLTAEAHASRLMESTAGFSYLGSRGLMPCESYLRQTPPRQNTICPPAQTHILIFPFSAGKQCRCRAEPLVGFHLKRVLSNVFDYWTKKICKQRQRLSLRPSLCSIVNVSINNNHSFPHLLPISVIPALLCFSLSAVRGLPSPTGLLESQRL